MIWFRELKYLLMVLALLATLGLLVGCDGQNAKDADEAGDSPFADGDDDDDRGDDNDFADDDEGDEIPCDPDPLFSMTYNEDGAPGFLREKAMAHDLWVETWHLPDYGSHLHVKFTDETQTVVDTYHGHGDSCIWTGTYIASQAMRYHITGEQTAKDTVIRLIHSLTRHLNANGRQGFISRYVGSASNPGHRHQVDNCDLDENCHLIESGEYAGDFWIGNTSRDQYTGWFMGMAFAFDLVADPDLNELIKANVTEVLDRLIADKWWIIDADGKPTTKAPNVLASQKMAWSLIGYHITGEQRFFEIFDRWAQRDKWTRLRAGNLGWMNKYSQHYGLNLAHENFLGLLRLARPYCEVHEFLQEIFTEQTHRWVHLQHNPWYSAVYLAQGAVQDEADYQANKNQIIEDLIDFPDAPKEEYAMQPPEAEIDPVSVMLYELQQQFPALQEIMGSVQIQAKEAYPVKYQCSSGFIFQRNMWATECGGVNDPSYVNSGHDFLIAYWTASAYGILDKSD